MVLIASIFAPTGNGESLIYFRLSLKIYQHSAIVHSASIYQYSAIIHTYIHTYIIWDIKEKTCKIVEVTCPLDTNIQQAFELKQQKYIQLISQMQLLHPGYKFSRICRSWRYGSNSQKLRFKLTEAEHSGRAVGHSATKTTAGNKIGTIKIMKTVMKM